MAYPRTKRIGEEIKKVISRMIVEGLKDPRVSTLVSVTEVEVTSDLSYATVYVSILTDKESTLAGLKSASGFIRREVGKSVKLRHTPELIFKLDESIEKGLYMSDLIRNLNTSKENKEDTKDE